MRIDPDVGRHSHVLEEVHHLPQPPEGIGEVFGAVRRGGIRDNVSKLAGIISHADRSQEIFLEHVVNGVVVVGDRKTHRNPTPRPRPGGPATRAGGRGSDQGNGSLYELEDRLLIFLPP